MERKYIFSLIAVAVVYYFHAFIILLFISFLLTTAFLPIVNWLNNKNVPRAVSSVILILALLVLPLGIVVSLSPIIAEQGSALVEEAPSLIDAIEVRFDVDISQEVEGRLAENSEQLISQVIALTGNILTFLTSLVIVLVLTIYWLIYYENLKDGVVSFVGSSKTQQKDIRQAITSVETRLGMWVKAQLFISVLVGILTWAVLTAVGLPYAGILAVFAALLEIIPTLGPVLAAIPALLVAITISPTMFVVILIAYVAIQQIESYAIAPRLLGHTLKINPFIILLAIITGGKLLGLVGMLIAVPVLLAVHEVYVAYSKVLNKKTL